MGLPATDPTALTERARLGAALLGVTAPVPDSQERGCQALGSTWLDTRSSAASVSLSTAQTGWEKGRELIEVADTSCVVHLGALQCI